MLKKLITPVVNINGNTRTDLLDKLRKLHRAASVLEEELSASGDLWHGRNFQVAFGDEIQKNAQEAWHQRRSIINELTNSIEAMFISVSRSP